MKKNIINKGVQCKLTAHGDDLIVGTSYTAVLYYSPKIDTSRITSTAICENVLKDSVNVPTCIFTFSAEDTSTLNEGNCILEIYDTQNKETMYFDDNYAFVRSTSINS